MFKQALRWIFGQSLATTQLQNERFSTFLGLPILSSDAISSVAYAFDEMLLVMVPVIGILSFQWVPRIAVAIILLLILLTLSYRNVVDAYPNGGGAYTVAKENLNPFCGLIAGSALSIGYTLTVAVSVCAGTAAITSAVPSLYTHRVLISLIFILLLVIGNVRGVRESSRLFSVPTYAFVSAVVILIIAGIIKYISGSRIPIAQVQTQISFGTQALTTFLILQAFSGGCSALTGIEAISNAVPNFKEPATENAKKAYVLLSLAIILTFGGTALLVYLFHAVPTSRTTVLARLSLDIFGPGVMFFFIQVITAIILAMAANTAFAGFPTLLSIIAQDGYAPRQMAMRGHRLNFTNGIVFLALVASILIIVFKAETHLLIALYSVGVFISFTLSQSGMFVHWLRLRNEGWKRKAFINGLGALVTFTAAIIVGVTKFTAGAWIVFVAAPLIIGLMYKIKKHYASVAKQLDVPNDELDKIDVDLHSDHHIIIPVDSLNVMVIRALRYAQSLSPNVEVFHVETYEGEANKLRQKWARLHTRVPLVIKLSPYRDVVGPLTEYIDSEEHASRPGDIITVLLPQFIVSRWWELILHNNTSIFIANAMLNKRNVVVSVLPFYLNKLNKI